MEVVNTRECTQVKNHSSVISVDYLKDKEIKKDEVLDWFRIAESSSHLEEFARSLFMICAKFAYSCTSSELIQLFDDQDVEEETSALLHRFMSKALHVKCKNCRHVPFKCDFCEYSSNKSLLFYSYCVYYQVRIGLPCGGPYH